MVKVWEMDELLDLPSYSKTLILGMAGSGKTFFAGVPPKDMRCLYVDCDNSRTTLLNIYRGLKQKEKSENLPTPPKIAVCTSFQDIEDILIKRKAELEEKFDVVSFDALSSCQTMCQLHWTDVYKEDVPSQRTWGYIGQSMVRIIHAIKNLRVKVIVTCHLDPVYGKGRVPTGGYEPAVKGALQHGLTPNFDDIGVVVRMVEDGKTIRRVYFQTQNLPFDVITKSRLMNPPEYIENKMSVYFEKIVHAAR